MRFQVDSETVQSTASAAQATISRLQGEIAALHVQLVDLQASWSGAAAAAFQSGVSEWYAMQAQIEQALGTLLAALAQAGSTYAEAEQANARLFAR